MSEIETCVCDFYSNNAVFQFDRVPLDSVLQGQFPGGAPVS